MHIPYIFNMATEIGDDISKGRIETLTDGIFAIVMTILVLEFTIPHIPQPEVYARTSKTFARVMACIFKLCNKFYNIRFFLDESR